MNKKQEQALEALNLKHREEVAQLQNSERFKALKNDVVENNDGGEKTPSNEQMKTNITNDDLKSIKELMESQRSEIEALKTQNSQFLEDFKALKQNRKPAQSKSNNSDIKLDSKIEDIFTSLGL